VSRKIRARKNNQRNSRVRTCDDSENGGDCNDPRVMIAACNAIRCYFRVHAVATVVYRANIYQNAVESGTEFWVCRRPVVCIPEITISHPFYHCLQRKIQQWLFASRESADVSVNQDGKIAKIDLGTLIGDCNLSESPILYTLPISRK